jgi:hypothetical protein
MIAFFLQRNRFKVSKLLVKIHHFFFLHKHIKMFIRPSHLTYYDCHCRWRGFYNINQIVGQT